MIVMERKDFKAFLLTKVQSVANLKDKKAEKNKVHRQSLKTITK